MPLLSVLCSSSCSPSMKNWCRLQVKNSYYVMPNCLLNRNTILLSLSLLYLGKYRLKKNHLPWTKGYKINHGCVMPLLSVLCSSSSSPTLTSGTEPFTMDERILRDHPRVCSAPTIRHKPFTMEERIL